MATKADICNLALSLLGDSATVTAVNSPDGSPQAGHCNRWYPIALRELIEEYDWSFLITRRSPNALNLDKEDMLPWRYAFSVPSDCARIISLEAYRWGRRHFLEYETTYNPNNASRMVFCNEEEPVMRYVVYNENPSIYPAYFINALAPLLASMLVGPLKQADASVSEAGSLLQLYQNALSKAKTTDAKNGRRGHQRPRVPPHIRYRVV